MRLFYSILIFLFAGFLYIYRKIYKIVFYVEDQSFDYKEGTEQIEITGNLIVENNDLIDFTLNSIQIILLSEDGSIIAYSDKIKNVEIKTNKKNKIPFKLNTTVSNITKNIDIERFGKDSINLDSIVRVKTFIGQFDINSEINIKNPVKNVDNYLKLF